MNVFAATDIIEQDGEFAYTIPGVSWSTSRP
jgi:hypothetical protein